jgi:EmrB/QacA subfamily drug resistance transporter
MSTESRPQSASVGPDSGGAPPWRALPVVLVGIFMPTLDFFIVNVAVPSIQDGLHASDAAIQLIIAGYGVAYAAGLITGGRLGDLFGRRRAFIAGLAMFTLTSLLAGISQNAGELITARILQGVAAALVTPQVLGIITTTFTDKSRTAAFNAYGLSVGLAGVFGQILGGALIVWNIAGWGWRSIFLINVPVGLIALALAPKLVPESHGQERSRLDLLGMLLVSAGLVAVVLPVIEGRQEHWPVWTWVLLIAALPLLTAFAIHQRRLGSRNGSPLIDLGLFKERAFSAGLSITLIYFLAMGSFFLLLALYLQQGRGMSPLRSGLVFITVGAGFFITSAIAPVMAAKLGRQILAVGSLGVAIGYGITAGVAHHVGAGGSIWELVPGLLVAGFGMGFVTAPLSNTVLARVVPRHAAAASGALSTAQEAGGAIGVALAGIVYFDRLGHATSADAFSLSLELLIGFCVLSAIIVQFLPPATGSTADEDVNEASAPTARHSAPA